MKTKREQWDERVAIIDGIIADLVKKHPKKIPPLQIKKKCVYHLSLDFMQYESDLQYKLDYSDEDLFNRSQKLK